MTWLKEAKEECEEAILYLTDNGSNVCLKLAYTHHEALDWIERAEDFLKSLMYRFELDNPEDRRAVMELLGELEE